MFEGILESSADLDGLIDQAKDMALADIIDTGMERPIRATDFAAAVELTVSSTSVRPVQYAD